MDLYNPDKGFDGMKKHSMKPAAKKFTIYDLNDEALDLIRSFYKEVRVCKQCSLRETCMLS